MMNELDVTQSENESLNILYEYHVDESYLTRISENLNRMNEITEKMQKNVSSGYKDAMEEIQTNIQQSMENNNEVIELSSDIF